MPEPKRYHVPAKMWAEHEAVVTNLKHAQELQMLSLRMMRLHAGVPDDHQIGGMQALEDGGVELQVIPPTAPAAPPAPSGVPAPLSVIQGKRRRR